MINTNEYFDGRVKSLGYKTDAGKSTVGVIEAGEFEFGTSQQEIMTVLEGQLSVLLPDAAEWLLVQAMETFEVPAQTSFKVISEGQTSYLCQYR